MRNRSKRRMNPRAVRRATDTYHKGYAASMSNYSKLDNPCPVGGLQYQSWNRGYDAGQEARNDDNNQL